MTNNAILLISCLDQKGITASVTNFVYEHGGNIVHADQHIDEQSNTFFMRVEWALDGFDIKRPDIAGKFEGLARKFQMRWELYFTDQRPKAAIFVSKHLHCLADLLYRHSSGQLLCDIPVIISNHPDAKKIAQDHSIIFHEISVTTENKIQQEKEQLKILRQYQIDLVILARYHQILTTNFVKQYPHRIINIHHSFLPAFVGSNPYAQADKKGVKIIGATAHYVTEELDQGPIIEQDTVRVSHRDSINDLVRKGEDLERVVLSRAVRWHLAHKILEFNNKTVIFD